MRRETDGGLGSLVGFHRRPITMMCLALLVARSPPAVEPDGRRIIPDEAGTRLTPHNDAELACNRDLGGLLTAVERSWAEPMWPIGVLATRSATAR